jgi:sensor histidine kinase regulating citrate/malate metabolism
LRTQEILALIRRIRHDFGNHLQIISGYTELRRSQEVKDYITGIVDEMTAERIIFELASADSALYFYKQLLLARDLGIILRYEELEIESAYLLESRNEPYKTLEFVSQKIDNREDDITVYISLYQRDGKVDMFLSCEQLEDTPLSFSIRE